MPEIEYSFFRRPLCAGLSVALLVLLPSLFCFSQQEQKVAEGEVPASLVNSIGMKLVEVKSGEFLMGSKNEFGRWANEHQHKVRITSPYKIGAFEVTQGEYEKVTGKNPSHFRPGGGGQEDVKGLDTGRLPVDSVSWGEAMEFCRKLSALPAEKKAGRVYSLPTEAQWEYACRAGTATPFHYGEQLDSKSANFDGNTPYLKREDVIKGIDPATIAGPYLKRTTPVGSYAPNAWGIHDMHGNVWEWCSDWFSPVYYKSSPAADPQGPEKGTRKVSRGGGWYYFAAGCRAASRYQRDPGRKRNTEGFRVVCVIAGK